MWLAAVARILFLLDSSALEQRFSAGAARISNTCNAWLCSQLTSFPLDCQINKRKGHNSCAVWMNQNYTIFFVRSAKHTYFLVCHRILVISLCVLWDKKRLKISVLEPSADSQGICSVTHEMRQHFLIEDSKIPSRLMMESVLLWEAAWPSLWKALVCTHRPE